MPDRQIGNFDEVSIQCDIPPAYTVDAKLYLMFELNLRDARKCITVNLYALNDGVLLPPFVIMGTKTLQNIRIFESKQILQIMYPTEGMSKCLK